ncbi:neuropilin-1-like [Gigantopelta aegis]|uniref:neuropilin-1-like n=1 Tax=Gigantopelta aegis TaxID=1735272 RepID=UPI001B88861A|nr:neuropilin-1-like [Gigantopelta aegis]
MYIFCVITFISQAALIDSGSTTYLTAGTSSSYLTSPNYPNYYGRYEDERWLITALNTSLVINLDVEYSSIESSSTCSYDYVIVYDGSSASSLRLSRFCGYSNPSLVSTGGVVFINFISDGSIEGNGFRIRYWSSISSAQPTEESNSLNAAVVVLGSLVALAIIIIVLGTVACCCSNKEGGWWGSSRQRAMHVGPDRENSIFYLSYSQFMWPDTPVSSSRRQRESRHTHGMTSAPPYTPRPGNSMTPSFTRHSRVLHVQPLPLSPPPPYSET